jgi:hypothetical protein
MRKVCLFVICSLSLFGYQSSAKAQDILIPAGTLLHCTLDEPNLSSATADVGDPVICHMKSIQEFGHVVFPRGSYLGGHVAAEKDPGHFVGKGYLKLEFDRIGLPTADLPVPSKVIQAKGFKVDKQGDIVGHGHATRDVVEWMFPPLWPWKLLMLPARGPRPTLKGEEQITLRLMDDVMVPRNMAATDYYPNRPQSYNRTQPSSYERPQTVTPVLPADAIRPVERTQRPISTAAYVVPAAPATVTENLATLTLIALKSGEVQGVRSYRSDNGYLNFVLPNGQGGSVDVDQVDWKSTTKLNAEKGVVVTAPEAVATLN